MLPEDASVLVGGLTSGAGSRLNGRSARVLGWADVSWALPSWNRSISTEIYLYHACSYQEVEDGNAHTGAVHVRGHRRGGGRRPRPPVGQAQAQQLRRLRGSLRRASGGVLVRISSGESGREASAAPAGNDGAPQTADMY
jgi:hypothetical protein